jgi:hypothetical protein
MELEDARLAIERMKSAKSYEEFENEWKTFLSKLERAWNKAQDHYKRSPKWDGWKGKYTKSRKEDSLLKYLTNARGADEHTVSDITQNIPAELRIGLKLSDANGWIALNKVAVNETRVHIETTSNDPDAEVILHFSPEKTRLLPVVNRGVTYNVPTSHMAKEIDPNNVIGMAEMGLSFYESFLIEAEKYFVK